MNRKSILATLVLATLLLPSAALAQPSNVPRDTTFRIPVLIEIEPECPHRLDSTSTCPVAQLQLDVGVLETGRHVVAMLAVQGPTAGRHTVLHWGSDESSVPG